MKKIFLILTMLCSLLFGSIVFDAAPSLDDGAKFLKASERIILQRELDRVEKSHGIRCVVVTRKTVGKAVPGEYANNLIKTIYKDAKGGTILFLQVADVRKWYISTYGDARSAVKGNPGVEYMSKKVVPYLKKNEYKNAYMTFAQRADELLVYKKQNGKAWEPEVKSSSDSDDLIDYLIFGGMLAFICGMISFMWATSRNKRRVQAMSNVHFAISANSYFNQDSFVLAESWDNYLYSTTVVHEEGDDRDSDDDDSDAGSCSDSSSDGDCGGGGGDY